MPTVKEYKDMIGQQFMASDEAKKLYGFKDGTTFDGYFPSPSVEGVMVYVFAFGMWVMATLQEKFITLVESLIERLKPHTLRWYVTKAKAYQHCYELPKNRDGKPISDVYERIVEKAQIVKYAVAQELGDGAILIKAAKYTTDTDRTPKKLTDNEIIGLRYYISQIKDAGVPFQIISNNPDLMCIELELFYNPALIYEDTDGKGNTVIKDPNGKQVVRDAIQKVIENLPFNGDCRTSEILNAVNNVPGIEAAYITKAGKRLNDKEQYIDFTVYSTPESGYFRLDDLKITATPYNYGKKI